MHRYLLFLALFVAGCSVPDDDNWNTVAGGLRGLPPMTQLSARRWTANRNAHRFFDRLARSQKVFSVRCEELPGTPVPDLNGDYAQTFDVLVGDVLRCLDGGVSDVTIVDCVKRLIADREASYRLNTGLEPDCVVHFAPWIAGMLAGFGLDQIKTNIEEWDPDRVDFPDETERELVRSPRIPFWLIGVLTVGVGGVLVVGTGGAGAAFLPALCALSEGGPACPSNPNYPPGGTPEPGSKP